MLRGTFGLIFWIHAAIILGGYFSWMLFDWPYVVVGFLLWHLQLALLGDCILTRAQFGNNRRGHPRTTFYYQYVHRMGISASNRQVVIVADYIVPVLAVALAFITQVLFGLHPIWHI